MTDPPPLRSRAPARALLRTLARYALGLGMLPYGLAKLLNAQFEVPAWDYAQPLGETSGPILAWSFLGYAPWFQTVLGAMETLPALLLLFGRTWRLGALLSFPVLLHVVLTNFALDLWPTTRAISSALLALDVGLLLSDPAPFTHLLRALLPASEARSARARSRSTWIGELLFATVAAGAFLAYLTSTLARERWPASDFTGARQVNRAGTWTVEAFDVPGHDGGLDGAVLYFDFARRVFLRHGSRTLRGRFDADREARTFALAGLEPDALTGRYEKDGDRLVLEGERDGTSFRVVLRSRGWAPR